LYLFVTILIALTRCGGERYDGKLPLSALAEYLLNPFLERKIVGAEVVPPLADLLGRNGLQRSLMNDAEKMIVMYANQTLYNLSHGRMRIELKKDSQRAGSHKIDKALDLVVYDEATGNQAIPVDMVSGSQKFRIAISLAMAIGKHIRGNGSAVESVIIDEGFGSLDKAGRDDMILELSQLSQELSRVIVVSHQEEIANAFSNRYGF
jgi:DNA repair protein SbcC/Rad50